MTESAGLATPMFPLGAVLVPGGAMPLHIFEPRYRQMVRDCLDGGLEFGVVLIARGHEVGGGDVRNDIGCLASIDKAVEAEDGRWGLLCTGRTRISIDEWLDDDPYPRAVVSCFDDPGTHGGGAETGLLHRGVVDDVVRKLRQVLALGAEAGLQLAPATIDIPDDPVAALWRVVEVAPIGQYDRYSLLASTSPTERIEGVTQHLDAVRELIEFRLQDDSGT